MKVVSCDCFSEVGAEIETTNKGTFNAIFREYITTTWGATTGYRQHTLKNINYCPFCGKKIEVEE